MKDQPPGGLSAIPPFSEDPTGEKIASLLKISIADFTKRLQKFVDSGKVNNPNSLQKFVDSVIKLYNLSEKAKQIGV